MKKKMWRQAQDERQRDICIKENKTWWDGNPTFGPQHQRMVGCYTWEATEVQEAGGKWDDHLRNVGNLEGAESAGFHNVGLVPTEVVALVREEITQRAYSHSLDPEDLLPGA